MTRRAVAALLLFPLLFLTLCTQAQDTDFPLFETRASWVATSYRLDWPPFDPNASDDVLRSVQQLSIRMIMEKHRDLGMNTVVFQVFTHGTAMYESERVPWSSYLTGTPGKHPGWDPLAYAVEQAHLHGLELHAWFNVFQVGNPNTLIDSTHVRVTHPEWVKPYPSAPPVRDYWINPADPDARAWLVGNVVEIVQTYDVDGIHFDYIRYPSHGFSDDNQDKAKWQNGEASIFDWRRENVNMFVRDVYAAVTEAKPWVKVGSAPIGTYRNDGTAGFWAWNDLYQASRVWLDEGVHDYLAPQLYFDIGTTGSSYHDFSGWLQDWVANSNGRHIYAGHGTWREVYAPEKTFPNGEIARQIELTRTLSAQGQVHFRHSFVNSSVIGGKYNQLALPPPMPWREAASAPSAPANTDIQWDADAKTITISWTTPVASPDDPLRRYAVFRNEGSAPDVTAAADLVAILGAQDTSYAEVFTESPELDVNYTIVAQSLLGMTSSPGEVVSTGGTPLASETPSESFAIRLSDVYPNPTQDRIHVIYGVDRPGQLTIEIYDLLGRKIDVLVSEWHAAGEHRKDISLDHLAAGVYYIKLEGGVGRDVRRVVKGR